MQKQRPPHFWGGLEIFIYFPLTYHLSGVTMQVHDVGQTVVLVQACSEGITVWDVTIQNEWIGNNTVAGLEGNTWLESARINCTYHL